MKVRSERRREALYIECTLALNYLWLFVRLSIRQVTLLYQVLLALRLQLTS